MRLPRILTTLLLAPAALWSEEWVTGQAARAVLGQSSFAASAGTMAPTSLVVLSGRLYVADESGQVLTFDVSQIGQDQEEKNSGGACLVCYESPIASVQQFVPPGVARFARYGASVAIADTENARVVVVNGPDQQLITATQPASVALDEHYLYVGDMAEHRVAIWKLPAAAGRAPDFTIPVETPAALASDGQNLYVADSARHRVLVFSRADRALPPDAVVHAASHTAGLFAPGTLVRVEGPVTELVLDGRPIPVAENSAQFPYDIRFTGEAVLWGRWTDAAGTTRATSPLSVNLVTAAPGLFTLPGSDAALAFHEGSGPVSESDAAKAGETIQLWATGLGAVVDGKPVLPVTALVNGEAAEVLTAGLPQGAAGVHEIQLRLPSTLRKESRLEVRIAQNGSYSNSVFLPVDSRILN